MFNDEFKDRYTTIPLAISRTDIRDKTKEVILHQHGEIELISMTEGEADFYINSRHYALKAGDVLIIPPYALHRARTVASGVVSYLCICFRSELLCDETIKETLETNEHHLIPHTAADSSLLQEHIRCAYIACDSAGSGWELETMGHLFLLFGRLKETGFFSHRITDGKETNFGKTVMTYVVAHYSSELTSRCVADALYMNYSYFCRLFKKTFGCCFSNYLLAFRLEKATSCLASTELSVTEIAFKVGINDCSYFCKAFKERFHTTPLAYRKSVIKKRKSEN